MYGDDPRELPLQAGERENGDRDHRAKHDEEEAIEFNRPQLSSLRRTPFRRMGAARKITLAGRAIVCWTEQSAMEQPRSLVS